MRCISARLATAIALAEGVTNDEARHLDQMPGFEK
jgi:hypothetical protein